MDLSVVLPLEDLRGEDDEHIRTWTHEQSLPRERYQLVIGSPSTAPATVEQLLQPHDAIEHEPGGNVIALWDAARKRAEADWLVLTEAHCEADPACLAALVRAIEREPDRDAFTLEHGGITPTRMAELMGRWFEAVYEDWARPGQWTRLNFVGIAIRKEVLESLGGLDARYGLFAAPLVSARLDARDGDVGHVPDARVLHVHNETIEEHHLHSANYARGECEARTREDRVFCERYFGANRVWTNRQRWRPAVARRSLRALADSTVRAAARNRPELPWLARELALRVPAALAGVRPSVARDRILLRSAELAARYLPPVADARYRAFLRGHDYVVRLEQLKWVLERDEPLAPALPLGEHAPVETLDHHTIIGVYGLEPLGERWFRWGEPVTVLRLEHPGGGDAELRIETGGVRTLGYLRGAYVDGRRVPPGSIRSEGATVVVPLPPGQGELTVTLVSRPMVPGGGDDRRLGMPIAAVGCARS